MSEPDRATAADEQKPVGTLLNELAGLILAYVKQETVDPLKDLFRFIVWGVAGALLLGIGGALLVFTAIRVIQAETGGHLTGNFTWVPYAGGMLLATIGIGWSISRIGKRSSK
jgi:uncharacterized membrane protein